MISWIQYYRAGIFQSRYNIICNMTQQHEYNIIEPEYFSPAIISYTLRLRQNIMNTILYSRNISVPLQYHMHYNTTTWIQYHRAGIFQSRYNIICIMTQPHEFNIIEPEYFSPAIISHTLRLSHDIMNTILYSRNISDPP